MQRGITKPRGSSSPLLYGVAVLSAALAALLILLAHLQIELSAPNLVPIFFAAVLVSAMYGGLGPELIIPSLVALASIFLFVPLINQSVAGREDVERLCGFVPIALLVSWWNTTRKRVNERLQDVTGSVGLTADIPEYKQAQEALLKLSAIVESSDYAIISKTLDGIVTSWNKGAERIYGYSAEEIIGHPISRLILPNCPNELKEIIERIKQGERVEHYQTLRVRKDGKRIHVSLCVSPIRNVVGEVIGAAAIDSDVTELKRMEEVRQTFSKRLMEAQESERYHIARELHDEIGQALTAIKINLQALKYSADASQFAQQVKDSIGIVNSALQQVRDLSLGLRPSLLDDLGLMAALRWYMDRETRRAGLILEFVADTFEKRLNPELETACFRIAQEALTNVVRHAQAKRIAVELEQRGAELHLVISDDGVGFDMRALRRRRASDMNLGLQGMKERALILGGNIQIKSAPAQGTEIHASFPLRSSYSPERTSESDSR